MPVTWKTILALNNNKISPFHHENCNAYNVTATQTWESHNLQEFNIQYST